MVLTFSEGINKAEMKQSSTAWCNLPEFAAGSTAMINLKMML